MALDVSEVKAYYDRFGSRQDRQGFYEDPPIERMIERAQFGRATRVFEFGCGTGRLAARLLTDFLPPEATYAGVDVSETMIQLASQRLAAFGTRATVALSPGGTRIPLPDRSVDRLVSAYVLDLLPREGIEEVTAEAHRVLAPGGWLCCVSLTAGIGLPAMIVSGLWSLTYRIFPTIVGGCRPISLSRFVDSETWIIRWREVLEPFGVPSEVLVAEPRRR